MLREPAGPRPGGKESAHARVLAITFEDQLPLLLGEVCPRDIERNTVLRGKALQLGGQGAVFGLGERLHRAFGE